jgi:tetratricopeptide (TPR) repeat protein
MPRLYLTFFVIHFSTILFGQVNTKKLVEFADQQYKKGDYYYAIEYYQKALKQDSTNIDILWKYAEVQRAYKNYVVAETYYEIVVDRDNLQKYPASLLQFGLMQKQNGKYKTALETFKLAKEEYENDKNDFLYKKAAQEVNSTTWAIKNFTNDYKPLEPLPETVNSVNAEFGHTVHDNHLIFSSLRADSINSSEEVYSPSYKTHLFTSKIDTSGFQKNQRIKELFNEKLNSGNGSFSLDGTRFYFSNCEDEGYNYTCKILFSKYVNGSWSQIDTLDKGINEPGKNSTMPVISKFNGEEVLFFASDKSGTKGGLDIWMAKINGNKARDIQNLSELNTIENEITPWHDTLKNRLYFSSTWHHGFGGQDVMYADFPFKKVENAGLPINSAANDQYFFIHSDTVYVSSNRLGTKYAKNPTCCSDIFAQYPKIEAKINSPVKKDSVVTITKSTVKLPVRLYFRNDQPDEDSWATKTKQNYLTSYDLYKTNYDLYLNEVGHGLESELATKKRGELSSFFMQEVDKGVEDLRTFTNFIATELAQGSKITLTIKGFASPLAKTNYNVNLTKRRISSLVNYFNEYGSGEFLPYLNNGQLNFLFAPFGEFSADQRTSDDALNQKESVYSKEAGIERKIHIEEVTVEKNNINFPLTSDLLVFNAGVVKDKSAISGRFQIKNISNQRQIFQIKNEDSKLKLKVNSSVLEPFGEMEVQFQLETSELKGFQEKSFQLEVAGFEHKLELFITTEVK